MVNKQFYVDDALVSLPDAKSAVELIKITQAVLKEKEKYDYIKSGPIAAK